MTMECPTIFEVIELCWGRPNLLNFEGCWSLLHMLAIRMMCTEILGLQDKDSCSGSLCSSVSQLSKEADDRCVSNSEWKVDKAWPIRGEQLNEQVVASSLSLCCKIFCSPSLHPHCLTTLKWLYMGSIWPRVLLYFCGPNDCYKKHKEMAASLIGFTDRFSNIQTAKTIYKIGSGYPTGVRS